MLIIYCDLILSIIYIIEAGIYYKEEKYKRALIYSIFSFLWIFLMACNDQYLIFGGK